MAAPIETLPPELMLDIFEHVHSRPPSELNERLQPSLRLTTSSTQTYKHISVVSRRWRTMVIPLLFKHSQLRLDVAPKPEWQDCPICRLGSAELDYSSTVLTGMEANHHARLVADALQARNDAAGEDANPPASESLKWACRFYHATDDYLRFITRSGIRSSVQSLVVITDKTMPGQDRFPHRLAATQDYRYRAAAALWQQVFSIVNPSRIVILAPPGDMACLTNCAIDLFGGDWAFSDMDFHSLTLAINNNSERPNLLQDTAVDLHDLQYVPLEYPGIAGSSIMRLKPWTHLGLNEGSFLKAYGTYHYFEMGAPSLVYSIMDCFSSKRIRHRQAMDLGALRSLHYTAIMPFANHLNFHRLLPHLDELDIMLAPDPAELKMLSDKARLGAAELEDCWQEFFSAYRLLTTPFRTHKIQQDGNPKLKRFVCQDIRIGGLQRELDDEFMPLCLPCWAEMEPGVFVRQRHAPFAIDDSGNP